LLLLRLLLLLLLGCRRRRRRRHLAPHLLYAGHQEALYVRPLQQHLLGQAAQRAQLARAQAQQPGGGRQAQHGTASAAASLRTGSCSRYNRSRGFVQSLSR
jgi:hypothetical protein